MSWVALNWVALLNTVQAAVMVAVSAMLWVIYKAFTAGKYVEHSRNIGDSLDERITDLEQKGREATKRIDDCATKSQFDRASLEMSRLTAKVQNWPEDMRREFLTLLIFNRFEIELRRELDEMKESLRAIWSRINKRKDD